VAGFTDSTNLPAVNPMQSFSGGGNDVFVAKLNASGNGLVYCTYIGGPADDRAFGIAVDTAGSAYVAGATTSRNFPTRAPLQSKIAGCGMLRAEAEYRGNGLVYSTYLGGTRVRFGERDRVDAAGNAYVAGDTTSFAFSGDGEQRSTRGGQDAFVAKVSADGSRWCTARTWAGAATITGGIGGRSRAARCGWRAAPGRLIPTMGPTQAEMRAGRMRSWRSFRRTGIRWCSNLSGRRRRNGGVSGDGAGDRAGRAE